MSENEEVSEQKEAIPQQPMNTMYFLIMMIFMVIIFIPQLRYSLGYAAGIVMDPLFSFSYSYPLYTMLATGVLVTLINSAAAHYYTDWIAMARIQQKTRAFNKVYREAMQKRDMAKVEKLRKLQMKYMAESTRVQGNTMKATLITWLFVIAIFTWLWLFVEYKIDYTYIAIPWSFSLELNHVSFLFPNWILVYSAFTFPLAWVVRYIFKYFEFRKRLEAME